MSFSSSSIHALESDWQDNPRWRGVERNYTAADVLKLRGTVKIQHSLAEYSSNKLWSLLNDSPYIPALGALTGNQAVQMAKGGLKAVYVSGWQIAADGNAAGTMYPDLCLYPSNSVPAVVKKINNALLRSDQIQHCSGKGSVDFMLPLIADGDAGFGSVLNTYELMSQMIEAGAAGVHIEDQHPSAKKCGHLGGKVLVPIREAVEKLQAARLAADVAGAQTVLIARTDSNGAYLITSDIDARDRPFITGERTPGGFYNFRGGIDAAISRGLAFAPFADLVWCETSTPNLSEARIFAEAIHKEFPGKLLAYNCSPSFNWKKHLKDDEIAAFQRELGAMGYKFQFVTLAGFHTLNHSMFTLAKGYAEQGMSAYVDLQDKEFRAEAQGFTAVKHQMEVGTTFFDSILATVASKGSTSAMAGSTEAEHFHHAGASAHSHPPTL